MLKLSKLALAHIAIVAVLGSVACTDDKKVEETVAADKDSAYVAVVTPPVAAPKPAVTDLGIPTPAAAGAGIDAAAGAAEAEAITIFNTRCAACHGVNGNGDGIAAAALNPKPRAYSDKSWQASVDDSHIAKVIVEGGAAVGKSAMMPANPDLKNKPEVVKALVAKIRTYGK